MASEVDALVMGRCFKCNRVVSGDFKVFCEDCDGTPEEQAARAAKWSRERLAAKEKAHDDSRVRRLSACLDGIPSLFQGLRLDQPLLAARVRRPEAIAEARAAMLAPMVSLVGGAGSGKTSIAAAMLGDLVALAVAHNGPAARLSRSALWVSAPALARARAAHPLGEGEAPLVRRCLAASLLIVDDVGFERQDMSGAVGEVLYERHSQELHTWSTTGFTSAQLAERYGDGVKRRLSEAQYVRVIRCATKGAT